MSLFPQRGALLMSLLMALGFVLIPAAGAQMSWGTRRIEICASLQDTNAVAVFTFTNTTDHAISIHEARSSCGACTLLEIPKKKYVSGEAGFIKVAYAFGSRVGRQDSTIIVRMDDLVESTVALYLRVSIPEVLQVRPSFVFWRIGEEALPKRVSLKVVHTSPIRILGAKLEGEGFHVAVSTVEQGREYVVNITPRDTKVPAKANVLLETDLSIEPKKEFRIPTMVREGWVPPLGPPP